MFYTLLFSMMPYPKRMFWTGFGSEYVTAYHWVEKKAIRHHRNKLMELDSSFRMQEAGHELVRRREKARADGIGPLDPRYPDIFDVVGKP